MNSSINISPFSKSVLGGLLTGVIVAVVALVYNIIYRNSANVSTAQIIMPLTIFIGFPIINAIAGYIYFLLRKYLHGGRIGFMIFCLVALAVSVIITVVDTKNNSGSLFSGIRGLFLGMELITCILAAILIPYFAKHPEMYE